MKELFGAAATMKVLTIIGTRPEAVKMAPILLKLRARRAIESHICATGQHDALLEDALRFFGLSPDIRLGLACPGLNAFLGEAIAALDTILEQDRPDRVVVQGDTTSALAGAIAAANSGIPVVHVEAGLRTYDFANPWPEEGNRRQIDSIAGLLLAPTPAAAANLAAERLQGTILVTGNSGIDALRLVLDRLTSDPVLRGRAEAALPVATPGRPLVLATAHRRENHGKGLETICDALAEVARTADVIAPLHPNPQAGTVMRQRLAGCPNVHLTAPLPHPALLLLMQRADLILTDSGGIQEEAPTFGTPVLILRDATERPEAIEQGFATLVGTDPDRIIAEARSALVRPVRVSGANPFGDGQAADRIVAALMGERFTPFAPPAPQSGPAPAFIIG